MNKEIMVQGVKISNPDKIVFKKQKIKKIDIVRYYNSVYSKMKPFLENRLISVIRYYLEKNQKFFKKHPEINENVERFYLGSPKVDKNLYFYLSSKQQLIQQTQLNSLEFHLWASNIKNINKPDIMVFDLDPDENISLKKLRQAVKELKNVLDMLSLKSFLKTSGGKGYHIYVPFKNSSNYKNFENFSKNVALLLQQKNPSLYITTVSKEKRKNKIFIDFMRNKKGATCVCPYSLRIRDTATVSCPIAWTDLDNIKPNEINIVNYNSYLKNNPWQNFFKTEQELK